jgi:hypothetical protein
MDTMVLAEVDRLVALADEHAQGFIDCMSQARSLDELRAALSGSFIAFLAEAARVTAHG